MRSITAFRFTTLCLLLGTFVKTSAAQYEVDGQIEQTLYKMDGSVQSEGKSRFTIFVKDCSWLIQTTNLDAEGKPLTVNETACTNGGVIYSLGVTINKDNLNGGLNRAAAMNFANIYSNNVPVGEDDGYFICHLWLMFASSCYFENPATNWLTPAYDLNASAAVNRDLKREAKWELINGPGSLPLKVVYLDHNRDGADRDQAATNATYTATGVTNAGELKIPSGFVFEQRVGDRFFTRFAPGPIMPGESAPTYRIRKRAVATVTDVRPYCSRSEFVPAAKGITQVTDERLARVPNFNPRMYYRFPDGVRWVSVEEAKKLVATQTPPKNPPPKPIVVVILLVPAAVVLFLWLLNRSKGQTVVHPNGS